MQFSQSLSWITVWFMLGSLSFAADNKPNKPEMKSVEFHVSVVEPSGKPVAGAAIQVWKRHDVKRQLNAPARGDLVPIGEGRDIRTDADGKAIFSVSLMAMPAAFHMWRNDIHLTAVDENHLVCRSIAIDSANVDHMEATMILRRLMTIEGRVIDEQGRPVVEAVVFHTGNASPRVEAKTDADGHFKLSGLPEGKSPVFVEHQQYHFYGQLVDTALAQHEFKLLGIDRTPSPMTTLPPLLSREKELQLARQIIAPIWEEAMTAKAKPQQFPFTKLEEVANCYVRLEPWPVYDLVKNQLNKADASRFFSRNLHYLYPTDPEEALDVLESLEFDSTSKTYDLIHAVEESRGISGTQKLELLDRAVLNARAISEPNNRIELLTQIALILFELGKVEEAKKLVEEIKPFALSLSPSKDIYTVAWAGAGISLFDLSAGVRLTQSVQDEICRPEAMLDILKRIAAINPAEMERIAAEEIELQLSRVEKEYHEKEKSDWPEEEMFSFLNYYEEKFAPICFRMASVDAPRAKRIALKLQNPSYRAYCLGVIADAVAKSDKVQARKLILEAYDILSKAVANPRRACWCWYSPPIIGAMLLPIVEEIDPTLVEECMWRAVSFRHHRPLDDFILRLLPEENDVDLSLLLARYDRTLASAIFPSENFISEPTVDTTWSTQEILVFTDTAKVPDVLAKDFKKQFYIIQKTLETLLLEPSRRWDEHTIPYK
jgi:tetratricopeptide (TPR) repeat protein